MLIPFRNIIPSLGDNVFVADSAEVIGDVHIDDDSSIWFRTVIRGDVNRIRIGKGVNIQDGTIIHVTKRKFSTIIGDHVTIGHGAILHGCTVGRCTLVGMGASILDGAIIGENSLVAAGALIAPGKEYPAGVLLKGSPARVARELSSVELEELEASWKNYVKLKNIYLNREDIGEVFYK